MKISMKQHFASGIFFYEFLFQLARPLQMIFGEVPFLVDGSKPFDPSNALRAAQTRWKKAGIRPVGELMGVRKWPVGEITKALVTATSETAA